MTSLHAVPTAADITVSHSLIAPLIHRTPVLTCRAINAMTGADLYFKCENFQKIGAFKMRGAANAALRLSPTDRERGLATTPRATTPRQWPGQRRSWECPPILSCLKMHRR